MLRPVKRLWKVNSSRKYLADFAKQAAESITAEAKVLDAGAGDAPYREFFSHAIYQSTDLCEVEKRYTQLSYICDLKEIPIQSEYYDLVFCSQTLEHVPNPQAVVLEIARVIKPGGSLWLTAPFYYEEHEVPFDFFRYTQYGLSSIIQEAGLKVERISWLEGYFGTLAYQLKEAAKALPLNPHSAIGVFTGWLLLIPFAFLKALFAILSLFFTWLDLRGKYLQGGHCKNYAIVAIKQGKG